RSRPRRRAFVAFGEPPLFACVRPERDERPADEDEAREPDEVDQRLLQGLEIEAPVRVDLVGDQEQVSSVQEVMPDRDLVRALVLGEVLVLPRLEAAEVAVAAIDVDACADRAVVRLEARLVASEDEAIAGDVDGPTGRQARLPRRAVEARAG